MIGKKKRYSSEQELDVIKARTNLVMHEPFFGNLAIRMNLIETRNVKTFETNGEYLKYNPDFADAQSPEILKGIVAHEVMHLAMMHHLRCKGREMKIWQKACDYAINGILLKNGFSLPDGVLHNKRFNDMPAEEIYDIIYVEEMSATGQDDKTTTGPSDSDDDNGLIQSSGDKPKEEDPDGTGGGGDNKNGNAPNKNPKPDPNKNQKPPPEQNKNQPQESPPEEPQPKEETLEDPGGCGSVQDAPDMETMTKDEVEDLEREWKDHVSQAATAQKLEGHMPEWMEHFVKGMRAPKIHYTELLRNFLEEKTKNDYSWMQPNTRYAQVTRDQGISLPGMYSEEVGNIAFVIDSSGSISTDEKERYASEISQVLEDFPNLEIDVLYVDTRVANVQHITNDDLPINLQFRGGGGTSFVPGFKWLEDHGKEPKALIYFTDGYCSRYPEEPDYPVLWLCTSGENTMRGGYRAAPFGTIIGLEID